MVDSMSVTGAVEGKSEGAEARTRLPDVMDPIESLCNPLAQAMWSVHNPLENGGPRLIFPFKRTDTARVSEQESKILLCHVLERSPWYYSIETPTRETYIQSGTRPLSARVDVTVYRSRSASDRILNVELKAGTPPLEAFRKDFEKLIREGVDGLWFHTVERAGAATVRSLLAKMMNAMVLMQDHAVAAEHTLTLALCLLEERVLLTARFTLGASAQSQLDELLGETAIGWNVSGPGAEAYGTVAIPAVVSKTVRPVSDAPLPGKPRQKLLIFCPEITDDTLLHFNREGESYRLRAFAGRLAGYSPWVQPDAGTSTEFLQQYPINHAIDVGEERTSLKQDDRWAVIVGAHNLALGYGKE
jgi:hypothetical protein